MKHTLNVVTLMTDCGDGGYNFEVFNSEQELLAQHNKVTKAIEKGVTAQELEKIKNDILIGDDPYENGYVGHETLTIEIIDGKPVLTKPLFFHVGQ